MPRRDGPYAILTQRSQSSYEISILDNPGVPLGVYHTWALTPCNNDKLHYQGYESEITDAEYDELAKKAGFQTVGSAPDDRFSKVQHIVPKLSFNKVYSQENIEEFIAKSIELLNTDELKTDG
ncbi:DNA ligase [Trichonephila clavipes]|nr:DNA ligase [Trichonephila clavipes]